MNDMNSHISDIWDIQGSRIELGNKLNAFLTNKYSKDFHECSIGTQISRVQYI